MIESVDHLRLTVAGRPGAVCAAVTEALARRGWDTSSLTTEVGASETAPPSDAPPFGLLFDTGLLDSPSDYPGVAADLATAIENAFARHASAAASTGRVVVVSSRDGLGWPDRVSAAAAAGAAAAATRSLALQYGPQAITVNLVAGLPDVELRGSREPRGRSNPTPTPLLPTFPGTEEIAAAAHFFLHPRSGYLTGQIFHCCGGASLLSSLSV